MFVTKINTNKTSKFPTTSFKICLHAIGIAGWSCSLPILGMKIIIIIHQPVPTIKYEIYSFNVIISVATPSAFIMIDTCWWTTARITITTYLIILNEIYIMQSSLPTTIYVQNLSFLVTQILTSHNFFLLFD